MNCDHAFELMTDPLLDDSPELHAHLDGCPRCRQMYETLSPALGLFQRSESWREEFEGSLPEANGDDATAVELAERVAVRLQKFASPRPRVVDRRRLMLTCLVMGLVGIITAFGLTALVPTSSDTSRAVAGECTWMHRAQSSADQSSEAVVLSCVACHLSSTAE